MTAPAEVRYARASGDVDIAYTVFGEGPFDLVVAMGFVTHMDLQWRFPWFDAIRALGAGCRVLVHGVTSRSRDNGVLSCGSGTVTNAPTSSAGSPVHGR